MESDLVQETVTIALLIDRPAPTVARGHHSQTKGCTGEHSIRRRAKKVGLELMGGLVTGGVSRTSILATLELLAKRG